MLSPQCADIRNVGSVLIWSTSRCDGEDLHKSSKSFRPECLCPEYPLVYMDKPECNPWNKRVK